MIPEFSGDFIQWLRGFYYTAQTGSMSAATALMKRNQSALTHQIKSLEKELGVKLFRGTKANRELTEEGKYLLARAVQLFEVINETKNSIGSLPDELEGEIAVSAMYSALQAYLPERVAYFSSKYPKIRFNLHGESQQEVLYSKIETREVDLGVVCSDDIPAEFHAEKIFKSDLVLLSPKTGPYAVTELPYLEQIIQLPIVGSPDRCTLWQFLTRQFGRYGLTLTVKHVVEHQESLKECVALGMGVGILDHFVCTGPVMERINVVSLNAFFPPRNYQIVRRRNMFLHPHLKTFMTYLQDEEKFMQAMDSASR